MDKYIIEYMSENDFKKKERGLKKYNMLGYKKFIFEYLPSIREGNFVGRLNSENAEIKEYILEIPTDKLFAKVHGQIEVHYAVYEKQKMVVLKTICPEGIFLEGHHAELVTYKGVVVSKAHPEKDMFKINLLNMLNRD